MEVIKYAVVGTGRGKVFMSPPAHTGLKLTAVCDLNPDKLTIVKYRYDKDDSIQLSTDYDEMLEKADIDAVILANYFNVWGPPGICIIIAVLGFNFIGDGLRDALDPKMRR